MNGISIFKIRNYCCYPKKFQNLSIKIFFNSILGAQRINCFNVLRYHFFSSCFSHVDNRYKNSSFMAFIVKCIVFAHIKMHFAPANSKLLAATAINSSNLSYLPFFCKLQISVKFTELIINLQELFYPK